VVATADLKAAMEGLKAVTVVLREDTVDHHSSNTVEVEVNRDTTLLHLR
jgi:hypothetical protein